MYRVHCVYQSLKHHVLELLVLRLVVHRQDRPQQFYKVATPAAKYCKVLCVAECVEWCQCIKWKARSHIRPGRPGESFEAGGVLTDDRLWERALTDDRPVLKTSVELRECLGAAESNDLLDQPATRDKDIAVHVAMIRH